MGSTPGRYAGITMLLATLWLWPHVLHIRQVPDRGDPVFSAWRIARLAHQAAHDPGRLFDGNIFHPRRWTLAYSDATLLEGAIGAPFVLAGADPLVVANALFLLAFPLCALAFFLAGWRLTGDPAAGLVAGVLGAWYPFHGEHYSHLELQWFMFTPLAIVSLLRVIDDPRPRRAAMLALLVALQCLASMYLGLMLVAVLMPIAAARLLTAASRPWRRLAAASATAILILAPVAAVLAVPYERARADHGERTTAEVREGSAAPADYLKTSRRLAAYAWHDRSANRPERELFPGTSTLGLAALGAATAPAALAVPLVAGSVAAFDWSLGLNGATYRLLVGTLAPFRSIRVPARFAVMLGTLLILLAAFGARALLSRAGPRHRTLATIALVACVIFDLRLTTTLVDYYPKEPGVHGVLNAEDVVAAFPIGREIDYMYASTGRWERLLTGYSGFMPADPGLSVDLAAFPEAGALDRLAARGATHVLYTCAFERSAQRCQHNTALLDANPRLELVAGERWVDAPVRLYRFVNRR